MRCIILGLLIASACGCQNNSSQWRPSSGAVTHAVIFYLKTPGDPAGRQKIIETSRTFERIPGVLSVQAGTMLPSTRPIVDSAYDVGVVITFENATAMHEYDTHPIHREAVNGVLRELVGRIVVYDFTNP